MKSVHKIRRLAQYRSAFICPHADWFSEHRLSADLGIPILGLVDTTDFQSRAQIIALFREAEIITPPATRETTDVTELCHQLRDLITRNPVFVRVLVRHGFSQNDASVAYFDVNQGFFADDTRVVSILKKSLHYSPNTTASDFLRMIETVGAVGELVPQSVLAFPSVALLLSGDKKLEVIGTFDRLHHSPFRFAGAIVPEFCVDYLQLVGHAKRLGGVLLNKGTIGYVIVDFLLYRETDGLKVMGYDIRINAFPSLLFSSYLTLCAGFNPSTGKMVLLRHVGEGQPTTARYAIVQNAVTHPGLGMISMKDIRKACYGDGMFFDLLHRTGFKMVFFDIPGKGKNFTLTATASAENTLVQAERNYQFLVRLFGQKAGTNSGRTLANGLQAVRRFRDRIFLDQSLEEVPLPRG
jgi:hypothetical protein